MGKKLNTDTFIERAKHIHQDEYVYSLVDYKNNKTKVKIICKKHGEFLQIPINHIEGKSGCPKCYGNIKLTTEEFVKRSKNIHKDKYDYSLSEYKGDDKKIKIICSKHGIFEQIPSVHYDGHGCFKCANKNDSETFISKSKNIYGNIYDYSLVDYINSNTPVKIICQTHGEFIVQPHIFISDKKGCTYCNGKYKNLNFFIKDAIKIHGDKYQYELIDDLNKHSYISVICPNHGIFAQKIYSHMEGYGCRKCQDDTKRKSINTFIEQAKDVHGNKYDYSEVSYSNTNTKIKIKCDKHGFFYQRPKQHLRSEGCPSCNDSKGEKRIREFLTNRNIIFTSQKKFENCVNKNKLPFDFYLEDYNLCIEYDGEQHYKNIFGDKSFKETKTNDEIKNNFCINSDIKLIRIPYYEYNNIEKILDDVYKLNNS